MALRRIADRHDAGIEQHAQHVAAIVRRAADQEIVGRRAPVLLEPFDIGLEAAGGGDHGLTANFRGAALMLDGGGGEIAVLDAERGHR